ncbi:DUF2442 domain-containing protein [Devosia algicola]|uniref:DUF2442 domain-containing protein n=1 Tax=Devosia algicola TaxID=3026418 RepID=A0ABY7YLJ9_9HYPH|nr:DUF2442 domain-containing protein [Devosia algicola]WDR02131.1 DUF2442 domain-containing protein [Devosia algicola]
MSRHTKHTSWVHIIIRALHRLGGSAPYSALKPEIAASGEREFRGKWRQTVEGTIEAFSSDSIRGHKLADFAGGPRDVFRKVGHGHWALRSLDNPFVAEALNGMNPSESADNKRVFVHEHWRAWPGEGDAKAPTIGVDTSALVVTSAWSTDLYLTVKFENGLQILAPLAWFPQLLSASMSERAKLEIHPGGVGWPELELQVLVSDLFAGNGTQ